MKSTTLKVLIGMSVIFSCNSPDSAKILGSDLKNLNSLLEQELTNELIKSGMKAKDSAIVLRARNKILMELDLLEDEHLEEIKDVLISEYGIKTESYTDEQLKTLLLIKHRDYLFRTKDSIGSTNIEFDNLDVYLINTNNPKISNEYELIIAATSNIVNTKTSFYLNNNVIKPSGDNSKAVFNIDSLPNNKPINLNATFGDWKINKTLE